MKRISSEKQYEKALARVEHLWDAPEDSDDERELDQLVELIEAYEEEHYPIAPPPVAVAVQFRMDQQKLSQADVVRITGIARSHVSEILSGTREPSKTAIRALHDKLGIPLQHLLDAEEKADGTMVFADRQFTWDEGDDTVFEEEDLGVLLESEELVLACSA